MMSLQTSYAVSERGAVLILMAFLLVAICGVAALAVDINVAGGSQSKLRRTAEYVALGALEAFLDTPADPGDPNAKLDAALKRATDLAGLGENFILAKPYLEDPSDPQNLLCSIDLSLACASNTNINGSLVAGKWHFVPPDRNGNGISCETADYSTQDTVLSPACPCLPIVGGTNVWAGKPCFEPLNNPQDPNNPPNAFRVNLRLQDDSQIKTTFASVLGQKHLFIQTSATAALVPRHVVFLNDLSSSVDEDTHLKSWGDSENPKQSDYAFQLNPAVHGTCPANDCSIADACQVIETNNIFNDDMEGVRPGNGATSIDCPGAVCPPWKHFRDDYQCVDIPLYSEDGVVQAQQDHYLLDDVTPPEPFESILNGINSALAQFSLRAVSGDLVGAIGFDQTTNITDQNNQPLREFPLSPPGSPTFIELQDLTDIANPNARSKQAAHLFIPRPLKWTNLPNALVRAQQLLAQSPGAEYAENVVVLFSDGLTNSYTERVGTGGPADDKFCSWDTRLLPKPPEGLGCISPGSAVDSTGPYRPWDLATYIWVSMKVSFGFLVNEQGMLTNTNAPPIRSYRDQNIAFHVVLAGDAVAPHTLLIDDGTGQCLDDETARKDGIPFIDNGLNCGPYFLNTQPSDPSWFDDDCNNVDVKLLWDAAIAPGSTTPFTYPNTLYYATVLTHGLWAPLRDPCPLGFQTPACSGGKGNPYSGPALTDPTDLDPVTGNPKTLVDTNGRLLCDPSGRSKFQQVQDYISQIMQENPFTIVD